MKLDNLKNRRPTSAGGGNKPWSGPAPAAATTPPGRPRDWRQELATLRFPIAAYVKNWDLTDAECESILLNSPYNRALIDRGGIVRQEDFTANYTVQSLGWACIRNGWSIVPQDRPGTDGFDAKRNTDERRPSLITAKTWEGRWKNVEKERRFPFYPTEYRERLMSLREFLHLEHLFASNLAIQCCASSNDVRVIDIDCSNPVVAERVMQIAFEKLGPTPFVRVGNAPKMQLIYRVEGADADIQSWAISIGDPKDGQGVEFLAMGKMFTAYGLHHKTKLPFDWSRGTLHPAIARSDQAPLITQLKMREFTNALAQEFDVQGSGSATSNPYGAKSVADEFDLQKVGSKTFKTPRRITGDWTMDEEGRVVDRAELWLAAQTWALCSANATNLDDVLGYLIEWAQFDAGIRLLNDYRDNDRFSTQALIDREVKTRMRRGADKFRASLEHRRLTGEYHKGVVPWHIGEDGRRPIAQRVRRADRPADGSLDWIPDDVCVVPQLAERPGPKVAVVKKEQVQVEADKTARALVPTKEERKRRGDEASSATIRHIGDWLATVPQWKPEVGPVAPWVIKGPTGVGKTAGTIDQLAEFCRAHPRGSKDGPILLVLPTHANASEALEKAIEAGMSSPDAWTDRQLELLEKDLKGRGVRIVRFRGREAAGCQRSTELRMLSDKGIGASRLCGAEVEDGDELDRRAAWKDGRKLPKVEILCPFREAGTCGYYNQMSELGTADIVVIPHAYLTISKLPKALRSPRAVIIDESVTYALLGQTRMPVSTLRLPRREPYVTKTDRKIWPTWSDDDIKAHYVSGRENACSYAIEWLAAGKDVAVEFSKLPNGSDLIACAITMNERANDKTRKVRPDLTPAQVQAIADEASGRFILAEIRWWKTVRDRMERLAADMAKGDHDMRWQVVQHPETIVDGDTPRIELTPHLRLSWRNAPNWLGFPTLLLDASANERIITKLFAAAPEMRVVKAQQHGRAIAMIERTWSNSSFIPPWDATEDEIKKAAETIEQARRLITTIAVIYGHGRVLVGSTIAVREVITGGGWVPPPNVDFVHYGALRGLDFAKHHVAAISFGRSEQPIGVIDGYKAALTFDDDDPEEPYDKLGTGLTEAGKPLFRPASWSRIEMRTGEDVDHMVPSMPARPVLDARGRQVLEGNKLKTVRSWGQDLEESWREEEIRQFLGRLRLVYRSIDDDAPPPVWISVGKIIPSGVVVDEIVEMGSVLKAWPMAELVRLGGGVLSENVTPNLPGAQAVLQGRTLKELAQALPKGDAFIRRWAAPFAHARYRVHGEEVDRSAMLLPAWYEGGDIQDHWMGLSERYGLLPDVQRVSTSRLHSGPARRKPIDRRDVDRDWQLESEIWVRSAKPADIGGTEFLIRHARGEYDTEETDPPAE